MRELKLVGLSADGRQVVFVDVTGAEFASPADDRLRAALRGDRSRLGQLEIEMTSLLRPRDIQARIRAGDTPEAVAALAQVTVEKVMPYCIPVLAEREHISQLARRSHVRRKTADSASRALSDVVSERLRGRGIDPGLVEWDAWRRDDGRWEVQAAYHSGERERSARFIFDAVGHYSLPDDDEAKWLTGEPQATSKGPQPREGGHAGERRLAAVPDDGDDLLAVARAIQDDAPPEDAGQAGAGQDDEKVEPAAETDSNADEVDETPSASPGSSTSFLDQVLHRPGPDGAPSTPPASGTADAPTEPTPSRKRRGKRASVPTWDEIMFGKDDPS